MTQAAEVDPLLEPPDELPPVELDELDEVDDVDEDGLLELEDSFGVLLELLELLDPLSVDEDVLRESLR